MKLKFGAFFLAFVFLLSASGCKSQSYPGAHLRQDLEKICKEEYGIDYIDVKVVNETIGVYLPLKKLFTADFKEAAVAGKVRNLESLFEPSPEALEKIEDVLFSISRVILSTDLPLKFYVLQATDVEKTGMQLVLTGYVEDIKRVRIWDISREEYRKRVIHELKLNRASRWHQPIHIFFEDLKMLSDLEVQKKYFGDALPMDAIQNLFFNVLRKDGTPEQTNNGWDIIELRSAPIQKNEVLVYAKVKPQNEELKKQLPNVELEYLFMLSIGENLIKIARIIPFQYRDKDGLFQKIPFPPELQIQQNIDKWEEEFHLDDVKLGPFLAQQMNRRAQALTATDERIQNTFREVKIEFTYQDTPPPAHFDLTLEGGLNDFNHYSGSSIVFHEDMIYLLNKIYREFVDVLRSYNFGDYDYLSLKIAQDSNSWIVQRNDLEMFRKNKMDLQNLLTLPKI